MSFEKDKLLFDHVTNTRVRHSVCCTRYDTSCRLVITTSWATKCPFKSNSIFSEFFCLFACFSFVCLLIFVSCEIR